MKVSGVTFTIDRAKLQRSLVAAVNTGINRAADVYVAHIKDSFTKTARGTSSLPGQPPSVQRGTLRRGIAKTPAKNGVSIVHTSNVRYAPMLEYGGTIRARGNKALPVPVGIAGRRILERAGPGGLRASGVPMRLIPRKGRPPLLVRDVVRKAKGSSYGFASEILFVLKKSVTIKPRPFMAPAERNAALYTKAVAAFEAGATAQIRKALA